MASKTDEMRRQGHEIGEMSGLFIADTEEFALFALAEGGIREKFIEKLRVTNFLGLFGDGAQLAKALFLVACFPGP